MKKVFNSLFVIIAAMVTFAGCAKQEIDTPATPETKTVQFFANSIETKTAFGTPDGTTYPTLWTANDTKVTVAVNGKSEDVSVVPAADGKTASFKAELADDESGAYQFYAFSPSSAKNNISSTVISANIWAAQTPSATSVDEAAMVLYAVSENFTEFPASVSLNFKHFTAYGKLSFKNLDLSGATVNSVSITSSANIAGRWNYIVESEKYEVNSPNNTITLTTSATEDIWFACAPVGSMDAHTLKFTIATDKGPLTKEVTLAGDKYKFEAGHIANMVVDMSGIEFAKSAVYELVTDVDDLTEGSEVIIAAAGSNVALSTTQNTNNRAEAGQNKTDNTIVDPADNVEIFEIEEGSVAGTYSLLATKTTGYIYAAGGTESNNHLRTKATKDAVSSWTISVDASGVATLKCADETVVRNTLRYNSNNKIFSCYASGQLDVAIYKLQGSGSAPLPKLTAPVVTAELNDDETGINVSWEEVANATSYVISGIGDDVTTTETSCLFEELSSGTYTITVTAKADGYKSATSAAINLTVPYVNTGSAKTYTLTIDSNDLEKKSGSGYAAYNGTHTLTAYASDNSTMSVVIVTSQVMPGTNPSGTLQFQASKGTLYNQTDLGRIVSVEYDVNKGTGISAVIGSSENPSTETVGGAYFVVKKATSSAGYLNSITIIFEK